MTMTSHASLSRWGIALAFGLAITVLLFVIGASAQAQELETVVETQFDAETIVKGFTLESHDHLMRLGIRPGTLNVETRVDIKTLDSEMMENTLTSFATGPTDQVTNRTLLGNIYLFDILNKSSYDGSDFFFLEIKYPEEPNQDERLHGRRKIYFWNGVANLWEELPSEDSPENGSVRALIHLPYARLAIFEDQVPETGVASWYAYKDCDCAASPDYPKGTYLVVSRADDPTRSVTVVVNDWGPDRTVHPERIIDLDKVAFEKIGNPRGGVLDVIVRLLQ